MATEGNGPASPEVRRAPPAGRTAVVVGAGLAGLSCSFELACRGWRVILLEAKGYPGGRTASWDEQGMRVESGLHRYLGFYRAFPDLLRRAGLRLRDMVIWEDEMEVRLLDGGPRATFGMSLVGRPFETIGSFVANNRFLPPADKLRLVRFLAAGLRDYRLRPGELDKWSVAAYAEKHRVGGRVLERILVPLTAGLFFLPPDRYSAYVLFGMVSAALRRLHRMRIGAFLGGMTEVLAQPLADSLSRRGVDVRLGVSADALLVDATGCVRGVATRAGAVNGDHVVLATSLAPAQRLVGEAFGKHPGFAPLLALPSMPAVTLQMELKRPALPVDRVTFGPGTVLAAFSEQSRTTFRGSPGRLSAILSPPEPLLATPHEELVAMVLTDARRLGMDLRDSVTAWRVVSHPADFYALSPGAHALRPHQRTPVAGLTLAGDYTRQPLFATMEGAVISGRRAAAEVQKAAA